MYGLPLRGHGAELSHEVRTVFIRYDCALVPAIVEFPTQRRTKNPSVHRQFSTQVRWDWRATRKEKCPPFTMLYQSTPITPVAQFRLSIRKRCWGGGVARQARDCRATARIRQSRSPYQLSTRIFAQKIRVHLRQNARSALFRHQG